MIPHQYCLSVDPGLGGTGVVVWQDYNTKHAWENDLTPLQHTILTVPTKYKHDPYQGRGHLLCEKLRAYLSLIPGMGITFRCAYIEQPKFFEAGRGQKSAKQGDLVKLSVVTGMLAECLLRKGVVVVMVPVEEWLGQTPERVVRDIVDTKIPGNTLNSHAMYAAGVGLYVKGHFK